MTRTRQQYEHDIQLLQSEVLEMASSADEMVGRAIDALMRLDGVLLEQVIASDNVVDRLDLEIENKCLNLIAQQQPVARDLRIIGAALKLIGDVERIADYAVDIALIGRNLISQGETYVPLVDLPRLTDMSRAMLRDVMEAYVQHDVDLADRVIRSDQAVNDLYHEIRDQLTQKLVVDHQHSRLALSLMFVAKYIERIGDHAVNIAERVTFVETGELRTHSLRAGETP